MRDFSKNIDISRQLVRSGIPFQIYQRGSVKKITLPNGSVHVTTKHKSKFSYKDLGIIRRVKKAAINHTETYSIAKDFRYIGINNYCKDRRIFRDVTMLDLRAAYWMVMYQDIGVTDSSLFFDGLPHKQGRNASIGNLASRGFHAYVNENGMYEHERYDDPIRKDIYMEVCRRCSRAMESAMSIFEDKAFLFWVDAVFVKSSIEKDVVKFFDSLGFDIIPKKRIRNLYRVGNNIRVSGNKNSFYSFSPTQFV